MIINAISSANSTILNKETTNFDELIQHLKFAQQYFNAKNHGTAKIPVATFSYKKALKKEEIPFEGKNSSEVYKELSEIIEGSFKSDSSNALFNLIPNPITETTVASILMQIHNINAIMDSYGGKSILFEQKVTRSIGKLIGWNKAYGISCNGGKITMFYAIKFAIQKLAPESVEKGIPDDIVILVSGGGHYSIEHTCSLVGLGSEKCIRVNIESSDGMSKNVLKKAFEEQIKKGKRVAAIISCGGTTLDYIHEDTEIIYKATEEVIKEQQLSYTPHLHLDSVIGWLWFVFMKSTKKQIQQLTNDSGITTKLLNTLNKLSGVHHFDSIGIDFHKTGLCPYSSSFFIAKNDRIISNKKLSSKNFGELRAFDYTLENSRPTSGIASAWTSLQTLGIKGYQNYLIQLFKASKTLKNAIEETPNFKVINQKSNGWEIIFTISSSKLQSWFAENYDHKLISESFINYIWKKIERGKNLPLFSIIKNYQEWFEKDLGCAFIIYNMDTSMDCHKANEIIFNIASQFKLFESDIIEGKTDFIIHELETPIR